MKTYILAFICIIGLAISLFIFKSYLAAISFSIIGLITSLIGLYKSHKDYKTNF